MEDQLNLTLGEKNMGEKREEKANKAKQTCKRRRKGKKKKKKKKRKEKEEEEKKKQPTASHPSVKGLRPQERWIGAHWESQEANPLPSYRPFSFGPHYRLPAF